MYKPLLFHDKNAQSGESLTPLKIFSNGVTLQSRVQRHMGSGGGLYTRSDSVADPLLAERLSVMANA